MGCEVAMEYHNFKESNTITIAILIRFLMTQISNEELLMIDP